MVWRLCLHPPMCAVPQVAVKVLSFGADLGLPGHSQARALLEAAISSNLTHANIVSTYAYELRPVANPHGLELHGGALLPPGQEGWRLHLIQARGQGEGGSHVPCACMHGAIACRHV